MKYFWGFCRDVTKLKNYIPGNDIGDVSGGDD